MKKLVGRSKYKARKGVDTSLNGIYWGRISITNKKNIVLFKNEVSTSKKEVKQYEVPLEKSLVYPVLRGKNIRKWVADPELFVLTPYYPNGKCISKEELLENYPNTYRYFYKIDPEITKALMARGIYQKHLAPAKIPEHGLYNIGRYTFSKYKVVWKALANGMIASVISNDNRFKNISNTLVIPDHNVLMIPIQDKNEAHYLSGVLNSSIVSEFIKAYISWFYSSHILENISIPDFNYKNNTHIEIVKISKQAHITKGLTIKYAKRLDQLVISILG